MSLGGLRDTAQNNSFTLIYPLLSLVGGVAGVVFSRKWGGFNSYFGSAISFFSIGLLAQFFGQAAYAFYIYVQGIEVPYPSIGDIGYFGSAIFYICGAYFLAQVAGIKISFKSLKNKFLAFLIPAALLGFSYLFFLRGYEFDLANSAKIFLDFGYPFSQAIYVSIAILAFLASRKVLGGLMQKPILFLILALTIQYLCDFMFLYQANKGTWHVGGINDYLYLVSYLCMTLGLVYVNNIFEKIKES